MSNNMTSNDKQFTTEFLGFTGDFEYARDSEDRLTGNNDFIGVTYCTAVSGYEETTEIEGVIDDFSKNIITLTRDDGAEVTIEPDFEKDTVGAPAIVRTNGRKVGEIEHDGFETGYTLMRVDHLAMMESEESNDEQTNDELSGSEEEHPVYEIRVECGDSDVCVDYRGGKNEAVDRKNGLQAHAISTMEYYINEISREEYEERQEESKENREIIREAAHDEPEPVTDGGAERPLGLKEAGDALRQIQGDEIRGEDGCTHRDRLINAGISYLPDSWESIEAYNSAEGMIWEVCLDVFEMHLPAEEAVAIIHERGGNLYRVATGGVEIVEVDDETEIETGQTYDNQDYQIEVTGLDDGIVEATEGDRVEYIEIEKFKKILKQEGYRLMEDYEQHAADLLEELEAEEEEIETDGGFKKDEFNQYILDRLDEILSEVESNSQDASDGDESHESDSEEESSEWSLSDAQEFAKILMNRNPQYREYHVNDDLDLIFECSGGFVSGYETGFMEEHGYRVDFLNGDVIVFTLIEPSNRPKLMTDGGSPLPPEEEDFRHGKPEDSGKECRLMADGGIPEIGASQLFTEDQEREIVYLNIIKRLSQREISMLCNCSQGTISRIVARYQSIGSDALKESIKSEYENQENRTFGREIEKEEIRDRWSEEFEETFLSEPIKVRWMGSLRDRISERHDDYTRDPDLKDYDEHSVRCFRVLSREHSQIVIKSQEEADAFLLMMRQYNTPGIHWMSVGMLNCAKRVCDEVREQLDAQIEHSEIDSSESDQEVVTDGGEVQ